MKFRKKLSKTILKDVLKHGGDNYYTKDRYKQILALTHYHNSWESDFAKKLLKYGYKPR